MRKVMITLLWIAVVGWMWAIFALSALPQEDVPPAGAVFPDYINHGAAYLLLAFVLFMALKRSWRFGFAITSGVVVGLCLIFGLINEINQISVPGRHFSLWDLLADGVGAALVFLVLLLLQKSGNRGMHIYNLLAGQSQSPDV